MKRFFYMALLALMLLPATAAFAAPEAGAPAAEAKLTPQENAATWTVPWGAKGLSLLGIGVGLGLVVIGGGKGIGAIGSHAVDAIARQPEAGGRIFTSMLISAALIEGVSLFAVLVALLIGFKLF